MKKPFNFRVVSLMSRGSRTPIRIAFLFLTGVLVLNGVIIPGAMASDERLVDLLRENLAGSGIDDFALSFTEFDGIVTLVGRVENGRVKENVIDMVRRTDGVVSVVDKISTVY